MKNTRDYISRRSNNNIWCSDSSDTPLRILYSIDLYPSLRKWDHIHQQHLPVDPKLLSSIPSIVPIPPYTWNNFEYLTCPDRLPTSWNIIDFNNIIIDSLTRSILSTLATLALSPLQAIDPCNYPFNQFGKKVFHHLSSSDLVCEESPAQTAEIRKAKKRSDLNLIRGILKKGKGVYTCFGSNWDESYFNNDSTFYPLTDVHLFNQTHPYTNWSRRNQYEILQMWSTNVTWE